MRSGAARSPEIRYLHDDTLIRVARFLDDQGFNVKANHIEWEEGVPEPHGGVTPDIEASRGVRRFYFEIETCESVENEMATKSKLSVLTTYTDHQTYAVMFLNCRRGEKSYNGCREFEKALLKWGLSGRVKVACYDTFSHKLYIDEAISGMEEAIAI